MAANNAKLVRGALRELEPSSAHKANEAPEPDEIYTPDGHADALDPDRALVVGGRGVGKSFWASVLTNDNARQRVSSAYPKLRLDRVEAVLGFHESAQGSKETAPSPRLLKQALEVSGDAVAIWQSVLIGALATRCETRVPERLLERVKWIKSEPEEFEDALADADSSLAKEGQRFLLVFDALDRLAADWPTIRSLTKGVAQLALELRGMKSIRSKIFMRRDQFADKETMMFPDSSKLRTAAVELDWNRSDLYGLLFNMLWNRKEVTKAMSAYAADVGLRGSRHMPQELRSDEDFQQGLFSEIAGEFMGANHRRGRTYSWVFTHLADAFGQTSPRSFLIALKTAAEKTTESVQTAIDYQSIREGVVKASQTRVDELQEDHAWVSEALRSLSHLTVPCDPGDFIKRWRERSTVKLIRSRKDDARPTTPVELELKSKVPEEALLDALINLAVIERRESVGKINVPDIFRVAANLKRKGGVPPRRGG